jgi:hypothetical protein
VPEKLFPTKLAPLKRADDLLQFLVDMSGACKDPRLLPGLPFPDRAQLDATGRLHFEPADTQRLHALCDVLRHECGALPEELQMDQALYISVTCPPETADGACLVTGGCTCPSLVYERAQRAVPPGHVWACLLEAEAPKERPLEADRRLQGLIAQAARNDEQDHTRFPVEVDVQLAHDVAVWGLFLQCVLSSFVGYTSDPMISAPGNVQMDPAVAAAVAAADAADAVDAWRDAAHAAAALAKRGSGQPWDGLAEAADRSAHDTFVAVYEASCTAAAAADAVALAAAVASR